MLMHHFARHASVWNLASKHFPERDTERIQIRADVDRDSRELLGAGKLGCPSKGPRY